MILILLAAQTCIAQDSELRSTAASPNTEMGDKLLADYFRSETERLTKRALADIRSIDDWEEKRETYRSELLEMLGLSPFPERTDLHPTIVGTVQRDDVVVERLHFQSKPGLYVTANLYRPKEQSEPLPAVLYVCGHGRSKTDGISNGNKVAYQHHGGWFARNGYVCLTIDTIQLGEIEGIHHGTYREKMWWWNNRGYCPAGVEAWNCIRALDYLETRSEVDKDRMGVTGRSGGGAYSWWIAAVDDRIKAAVPVAGITSLKNHVVDGCVEGHCDCMYMVNTYGWDYSMVAALVAPRPLLISNTDKDRIFPIDGVVDVYSDVRKIYSLYGARDKLGLHITEGPHKDTQELRVHAFRWMNRWLRDDESLIETVATPLFQPHELRVFDELPRDEIVKTIHETFVPLADDKLPPTAAEFDVSSKKWMTSLAGKVFRGWPAKETDLNLELVGQNESSGVVIRHYQFDSQRPYRLSFYVLHSTEPIDENSEVIVSVVNQQQWDRSAKSVADCLQRGGQIDPAHIPKPATVRIIFAPRGIGATQWNTELRKRTHIRRRFMQLGQTVATMQIWDVRRMLQALDTIDHFSGRKRSLSGSDDMAMAVTYASLLEPSVSSLMLTNPPTANRDAPDLLNVSRFVTMPQILMMAANKADQFSLTVDAKKHETLLPITKHPLIKEKVTVNITVTTNQK